jgi:hypothetical protein
MKDKIRRIANLTKFEKKSRQLSSDCAELIHFINEYYCFRDSKNTRDDILTSTHDNNMLIDSIVKKIADVEIVIDVIKHQLNINPEAIEEIKKIKVDGEIDKIEQEEGKVNER